MVGHWNSVTLYDQPRTHEWSNQVETINGQQFKSRASRKGIQKISRATRSTSNLQPKSVISLVLVLRIPKWYSEFFWSIQKYVFFLPELWPSRVTRHRKNWPKLHRTDMTDSALESSHRALYDAIESQGGHDFRFHAYFHFYPHFLTKESLGTL